MPDEPNQPFAAISIARFHSISQCYSRFPVDVKPDSPPRGSVAEAAVQNIHDRRSTSTIATSCPSSRAVNFFSSAPIAGTILCPAEQFAHLDEGAHDEDAHAHGSGC